MRVQHSRQHGFVRSLAFACAAACVLSMQAVAQTIAPPVVYSFDAAACPIDHKRMVLKLSANSGTNIDAELSSVVGFAKEFSVRLAPYRLLTQVQNTAIRYHYGYYVKFDMDCNGSYEDVAYIHGPGYSDYNANAAAVGEFSFPEPTYPNTATYPIRWKVEEDRTDGLDLPPQEVSGSFDVTIVPTPSMTYKEASAPTAEPCTITGFLSSNGLDRPLLIIEGYDATNATYPGELFGNLLEIQEDGNSVAAPLLAAGYDIFLMNLGDSTQDMRYNVSRVLGAVLKLDAEAATCDPSGHKPIRVLGISLGGVLARAALAWAEANAYEHDADMFISLDAPQQGSWLNYDFQHFLETNEGNPTIAQLGEVLKTPAAKQLLRVNWFDRPAGNLPDPTPSHATAYGQLDAINGNGYPHRTRNIALSSGAGNLAEKRIDTVGYPSWVGQNDIATFSVGVLGQYFPIYTTKFSQDDILGGSLQSAFRPQVVHQVRELWNGRVWHLRVHDPIALQLNMEIGTTGAPVFMQGPSTLDLLDVVRTGLQSENIVGWSRSKFDEIYINAQTPTWHDKLSKELASVMVQKLLEGRDALVAPAAARLHANGTNLPIEWSWRSATSVDFAVSSDGGQFFANMGVGISDAAVRTTTSDANAHGSYSLPSVTLPVGSHTVVRVTSHCPGGGVATQRSDEFTVWGIVESSPTCIASFRCDSPTLTLQIQWDTSIATDAQDIVEVYPPGSIPGVDTPYTASATSQGTHHLVNWNGTCASSSTLPWKYVVKSAKVGSGTTSSYVKLKNVTECASCPPPCNPPCELE